MRWTPEARAAQAQKIKAQKPWLHSTGPRTPEGKARVARNAIQHGNRSRTMKRFHHLLRVQSMFLKLYALKQEVFTTEHTEFHREVRTPQNPSVVSVLSVVKACPDCHPEQGEGSQPCIPMRSLAVAQDDKKIRLHHEEHEAHEAFTKNPSLLRDLRALRGKTLPDCHPRKTAEDSALNKNLATLFQPCHNPLEFRCNSRSLPMTTATEIGPDLTKEVRFFPRMSKSCGLTDTPERAYPPVAMLEKRPTDLNHEAGERHT